MNNKISPELAWLYRAVLKNKHSVYSVRRFLNRWIYLFGSRALFGGCVEQRGNGLTGFWWFEWCGRANCKKTLLLLGKISTKERVKLIKDYILNTPTYEPFREEI